MTLLAVFDWFNSGASVQIGVYCIYEGWAASLGPYLIRTSLCIPLMMPKVCTIVTGQLAHIVLCFDRSVTTASTVSSSHVAVMATPAIACSYLAMALPTRYRKWKHTSITLITGVLILAAGVFSATMLYAVLRPTIDKASAKLSSNCHCVTIMWEGAANYLNHLRLRDRELVYDVSSLAIACTLPSEGL